MKKNPNETNKTRFKKRKTFSVFPKPSLKLEKNPPLPEESNIKNSQNKKISWNSLPKINEAKNVFNKTISAPLNLLKKIMILIRVANKFKNRTKYRDLKFIPSDKIKLINDKSYFVEFSQKNRYLKRFTEKNVNFL